MKLSKRARFAGIPGSSVIITALLLVLLKGPSFAEFKSAPTSTVGAVSSLAILEPVEVPHLIQVVAVVPTPPPTEKKSVRPSPAKRQDSTVKIIGSSRLQCVQYARLISGNGKVHGYAGNLKPEGFEARIGAIALERDYGHVSVVVAIEGDFVILHDTNWVRGAITERRVHLSAERGYIY